MIAGRMKMSGVESVVSKDYDMRLTEGRIVSTMESESPLPFKGPQFAFNMKLPPTSGAEVQPEGSATQLAMKPDLSRLKEGASHGLLSWL